MFYELMFQSTKLKYTNPITIIINLVKCLCKWTAQMILSVFHILESIWRPMWPNIAKYF